jgi:hypothetical protein
MFSKELGKNICEVFSIKFNVAQFSTVFVTGNKKKLEEVQAILGSSINLVNYKLDCMYKRIIIEKKTFY